MKTGIIYRVIKEPQSFQTWWPESSKYKTLEKYSSDFPVCKAPLGAGRKDRF